MRLILTKHKNGSRVYWECDCDGSPGSPPLGRGKTKEMAIAAWFVCNADYVSAHKFEPLLINEILWQDPLRGWR